MDNLITLSTNNDDGIRLLDEGAVMAGDDSVWFYIEKGSLEKYMNALSDDFVGYIKYGHTDFANLPLLLGEYKKSDLSLRDVGDGRKALYVKPTWFDTYLLKDIKAMPYDVGVSVEMTVGRDEEATEKLGFDVYDDLFITGFAVVGEAGNVNSSDVRLSGGEKVALDFKSINDALENQSQLDLAALKDALDKIEDKTVEAKVEEAVEETAEEEAEESAEDVVEASVEEESSTDEVLAKVEELTAKVEELAEENKTLSEKIETLEADKTALTEKLSAKAEEEKKFVEKFKALTVHVSDPKPETEKKSIVMDGIGEL